MPHRRDIPRRFAVQGHEVDDFTRVGQQDPCIGIGEIFVRAVPDGLRERGHRSFLLRDCELRPSRPPDSGEEGVIRRAEPIDPFGLLFKERIRVDDGHTGVQLVGHSPADLRIAPLGDRVIPTGPEVRRGEDPPMKRDSDSPPQRPPRPDPQRLRTDLPGTKIRKDCVNLILDRRRIEFGGVVPTRLRRRRTQRRSQPDDAVVTHD